MEKENTPKVVILCGGKGTRLREQTEYMPKPLVPIGEKPILWHIMKGYETHGFRDFVLCLGYKGSMIRDYFLNYKNHAADVSINVKGGEVKVHQEPYEDWNVTLVNTGDESQSGLRVGKVRHHLHDYPYFMLTYGDGLGNINIRELVDYFFQKKNEGKIGVITGVRAHSRYGAVETNEDGIAKSFIEKPILDDVINGGFMIFDRAFLEHPLLNENIPFEDILKDLTEKGLLAVYIHKGFWHSMDTHRDYEDLNKMWIKGESPWKIW